MRAIPTVYEGVQFRSRLEARYAMFFDEHRIRWAYEVEGFEIDGVRYLPDFWLADSRAYFEVKGPHQERVELPKLWQDFIDARNQSPADIEDVLFVVGNEMGELRVGNQPPGSAAWGRCKSCAIWYPVPLNSGWTCRGCGHYDGPRTFDEMNRVVLPQMQWRPAA